MKKKLYEIINNRK